MPLSPTLLPTTPPHHLGFFALHAFFQVLERHYRSGLLQLPLLLGSLDIFGDVTSIVQVLRLDIAIKMGQGFGCSNWRHICFAHLLLFAVRQCIKSMYLAIYTASKIVFSHASFFS